MSEYINNVTRRKEIIKNVLQQLHEGTPVDEVKKEFAELVQQASSTEIAEVEQMLIDEGLPATEIQKLCDVHVAVFRESLDSQTSPETKPGHPVHTFRAENRVLEKLLDEMQVVVEHITDGAGEGVLFALRQQVARLQEFDRHFLRKENLLFPHLEKTGFTGPSTVMWGLHNDIRSQWKTLAAMLEKAPVNGNEVASLFWVLATALRDMIYKEEKILFPASMEHLTGADWSSIRNQEDELGFFLISPGGAWQPEAPGAGKEYTQPANVSTPGQGLIPLSTGALTPEQINLMLTNLPVDVTYVDENDAVRYFSQTRERIFERQAAIIGRKVQNCHPPQSMNKVQRILDDFRAGVRDVAEFWIQMGGKFIHIRYFALHDAGGEYKGTLEVSQDLTHVRSLEGERRLLDD